jgi:pimeloyl-ACP methyl ester carboxylesterase
METFSDGDVQLVYEDTGEGPAILCLAPGGLAASRIDVWPRVPWNPLKELTDAYRVVAMDQRNTGTSFAPVTAADGWGSYAADQLALMDHLGIETFAVVGMCIGGAFIMKLLEQAPERVTAGVALQPIGFDNNRDTFLGLFDAWRNEVAGSHPEARDADWEALRSALFGSDRLLWSVDDTFLSTVTCPLLVLQGNDEYHPSSVSQKLARKVASALLVERWKDPIDLLAADATIKEFLTNYATKPL